jgi:hypothetical protein
VLEIQIKKRHRHRIILKDTFNVPTSNHSGLFKVLQTHSLIAATSLMALDQAILSRRLPAARGY